MRFKMGAVRQVATTLLLSTLAAYTFGMPAGNTSDTQLAGYPTNNPVVLKVEMSNSGSFVGKISVDHMFSAVKNCLLDMCAHGRVFCDTKKYQHNQCLTGYSDARFTVDIIAAYWPAGYGDLRFELIEFVADSMKNMITNPKNCKEDKNGRTCLVSDLFSVEIQHWYGKDHELSAKDGPAYLTVKISDPRHWLPHSSRIPRFDCVGSQTPIYNYINVDNYKLGPYTVIQRLGAIIGVPYRQIAQRVDCPPPGKREIAATGGIATDKQANDSPLTNRPTLRVHMSDTGIDVFNVSAQSMQDLVRRCLNEMCPEGRHFCDAPTNPHHVCDIKTPDQWLVMQIERAYWPEKNYPDIRQEYIEFVSTALGEMILNCKNCENLFSFRSCVLPDRLSVGLEQWYGKDLELGAKDGPSYLDIALSYGDQQKKHRGFNCVGSQTPMHNYISRPDADKGSSFIERLGRAISERKLEKSVSCSNSPFLPPPQPWTPSIRETQNATYTEPVGEAMTQDIGYAEPNRLNKRATKRTLYLSIGTRMQHVGVFKGQELWDKVHDCLNTICPSGRNGHEFCKQEGCTIKGVGHTSKQKFLYDHELEIRVTFSYLPPGQEGLREIFLEQGAALFASFTDEAKNCYDVSPDGRDYQLCNVPQLVWMHVGNLAWMLIRLNYNKKTLDGTLKCQDTIKSELESWFSRNSHARWAKALNMKDKNELGFYAECQGDKDVVLNPAKPIHLSY